MSNSRSAYTRCDAVNTTTSKCLAANSMNSAKNGRFFTFTTCFWLLKCTGKEKSAPDRSAVCSRSECTKVSSRSNTSVFLLTCTGVFGGSNLGRFFGTQARNGGKPPMKIHGSYSSS